MKEKLIRYTKKRLKGLKTNLKKFSKSDDPELLHQVRVEIKRLKSLLGLIEFHDENFNAHHAYIPFRNIFRGCQAIREEHVRADLANQLEDESNNENKHSAALIKKFRKKISDYIKTIDRKGKSILRKIKKVKTKSYELYLFNKRITLRHQIYPTFEPTELHKTRKLFKEIDYLEAVATKRAALNLFYSSAASLIGDWHDRINYIEHLKKKSPVPRNTIQKLLLKNRSELKKLEKMIQEFMTVEMSM